MPLASAYLIGWGQHNDVGYDSTAFWMHVASGRRRGQRPAGPALPVGRDGARLRPRVCRAGTCRGRARGGCCRPPSASGCALALNGFAVACVTSAVKQYAVPAPGENPFTSRPGSAGVTLGVQAVCGAAVFVAVDPRPRPRRAGVLRLAVGGVGGAGRRPGARRRRARGRDAAGRRPVPASPGRSCCRTSSRCAEPGCPAAGCRYLWAARWAAPMMPALFSQLGRHDRGLAGRAAAGTPRRPWRPRRRRRYRSGHSRASRWL